MSKTLTISRWGPSLAVRIPQYIVDNLELQKGDTAQVSYEGNRILLELKASERPKKIETKAEEFEREMLESLREAGIPGYGR